MMSRVICKQLFWWLCDGLTLLYSFDKPVDVETKLLVEVSVALLIHGCCNLLPGIP